MIENLKNNKNDWPVTRFTQIAVINKKYSSTFNILVINYRKLIFLNT